MNRFSPAKLKLSKWTATQPVNREKHFLVTDLEHDEAGVLLRVELQAVHSGRSEGWIGGCCATPRCGRWAGGERVNRPRAFQAAANLVRVQADGCVSLGSGSPLACKTAQHHCPRRLENCPTTSTTRLAPSWISSITLPVWSASARPSSA